jgi:hypothetical protein
MYKYLRKLYFMFRRLLFSEQSMFGKMPRKLFF